MHDNGVGVKDSLIYASNSFRFFLRDDVTLSLRNFYVNQLMINGHVRSPGDAPAENSDIRSHVAPSMRPVVSIGIALIGNWLTVATWRQGEGIGRASFPASAIGAEAIRVFLASCDESVRLAVTRAELEWVIDWGRDTILVSSAVSHDSAALVRCAQAPCGTAWAAVQARLSAPS